eukprot:scaffold118609_cov54-Attheya_sp.AAC.1
MVCTKNPTGLMGTQPPGPTYDTTTYYRQSTLSHRRSVCRPSAYPYRGTYRKGADARELRKRALSL